MCHRTLCPCVFAVTKRQVVPSKVISSAEGHLQAEREGKRKKPCEKSSRLKGLEVDARTSCGSAGGNSMRGAEASSDAKSSSVAPDARGDVVREPQEPRKRRASSAPREEAARCSLIPDPNCDVCKRTSTRVFQTREQGINGAVHILRSTAHHKMLNVGSRDDTENALVQDDTSWIQGYPMKTEDTSGTTPCLQRSSEPKACQNLHEDLQWSHDTSTPHRSETKRSGRQANPESTFLRQPKLLIYLRELEF